ncbi:IS3 family transposase [Magnetovibrio sp. PR-2]|uniref:IS3 family transposase n=1 Tax=Magnetovibrio sp. PR-2 TaxID=3120356 RepID=UPI002FCE5993
MLKPNKPCRRRSQRDYSLGFKLSVVAAVEKGDMTYKQAQKIYGIQGRSTVLTWCRKHGKLDWTQPVRLIMPISPKAAETPAQKIKRLERELEDERLRTLLLNEVIDILDAEHGAGLRKKLIAKGARRLQARGEMSLRRACTLLGISRQSIYQREWRAQSRMQEMEPVKAMVMDVRRFMPRLGTRKLYHLLKPRILALGVKLGRDGLFGYLRDEGLLVRPRRSYTKTTWSKHWMRKHPNLLKDHHADRPEAVFVSDITYLESDEGVHYLSLVTDAYSRKIMGYEVSRQMKAKDVAKALSMAIKARRSQKPLIHHSDRGLQYCSAIYQTILAAHHIRPSMTDGYDCYQNALAERINGILKQEFLLHRCKSFADLEKLVEQSIDIYNHMRPHLSLGMRTPQQVHEKAIPTSGMA